MDDYTAFERQVAAEFVRRAGPVQPVDDISVLDAIHSVADTNTRRFPSMFTAFKFAAASIALMILGAFLFASVVPDDEAIPPAATTEATSASATISGSVSVLGVQRPSFAARLVVELIDTQASPEEAVLGRYVYEEPRRTDLVPDVETLPFVLDYPETLVAEGGTYVLEARSSSIDSGEVFAVSEGPVPVITGGNPTEDVVVKLITVPADLHSRLTGVVMAAPELPDLDGPARLVIQLVSMADDDTTTVLGESITDDVHRLRPPREYTVDFDLEAIDPDGTYRLVSRLEDAETRAVLGSYDVRVAALPGGGLDGGGTIRLEAAPDLTD